MLNEVTHLRDGFSFSEEEASSERRSSARGESCISLGGCIHSCKDGGASAFKPLILVVSSPLTQHRNTTNTNERTPKVNHLLYTIAKCLPVICEAEKCTCFLVDDDKDQLWVVQGEVNMRVPKSKGIAGAVATSGKVRASEFPSGFRLEAPERTNDEKNWFSRCWYDTSC